MGLSLKMDWSVVQQQLAAFGGGFKVPMKTGARRVLIELSNQIVRQIGPGGALKPHTGGLSRSWSVKSGGAELDVESDGVTVRGGISSNHPAARIQNDGGTVRPKNAKYLAIPLGPAKTGSGASRYASPRQVPDLVCIRSKAGKLLLVKMKTRKYRGGATIKGGSIVTRYKTGEFTPWWVLVDYTMIMGTNYLDNAVRETQDRAQGILEEVVAEEVIRRGLNA